MRTYCYRTVYVRRNGREGALFDTKKIRSKPRPLTASELAEVREHGTAFRRDVPSGQARR